MPKGLQPQIVVAEYVTTGTEKFVDEFKLPVMLQTIGEIIRGPIDVFPLMTPDGFNDRYMLFFWLVAAWVKSRAERPSVSGVNRQLLFFLARCCLGQVPGGAPFSQRSEQATACTNRMQIRN